MSRRFDPIDPDRLAVTIAELLRGARRVAVDGVPGTDPHGLADALVGPLRVLGRPALRVRAETFWRDASLRLEHGRTDIEAYAHEWLDVAALRREVLDPLGPGGSGEYLPALRDPATNRSVRVARESAPANAVLIVSGSLLLGRGLPFDRTVHLAAGTAAQARRVAPEWAWTLPAFAEYRDGESADILVRLDDPRHPALSAGCRPASDR